MESYRLKSRILENEKEYLIQTSNDVNQGVIKTSIFVDGNLLDANILPHSEDICEEEILKLVKSAHGERKTELEYLLKSYRDVIEQAEPKMMYHLGTALFHKRMLPEARELFRLAIGLQKDYHEVYYFLAQTEMALKNISAAVEAAERAVELRSDFADYRNNLGEAYLEAGSCKRAIIEFEEAVKRNVYYADAYFNLALSYILNAVNRENFELYSDLTTTCTDLFKKAILIYPDYQNQAYNEGISSLTGGDLKRAYNLLRVVREEKKEKVRTQKASHFNRFLLYTDWLSEGNIVERIEALEKELHKNPDYVDLYYELAICHMHRAKFAWQKGTEYLQKALGINRNLTKAKKALDLSSEFYLKLADAVCDITEKNG